MLRRGALLAIVALLVAAAAAPAASDPLRGHQYGLDLLRADAAHTTARGAGAVVAVIDTGADLDHPDLAGQLVGGRDIVDGDDRPDDGQGHGTHVSGIVAAATGNGIGVASVAPAARVMPVRVLDDEGGGTDEDIAAGIDWARTHGADVISLSLGDIAPIRPVIGLRAAWDEAIDRAIAAGIVVVAAAGNSGVPLCEQASSLERMLCVGAVDRTGRRPGYSSFAGRHGVMAAGDEIISTGRGGGYETMSGTSQATPHVAGVAGLLVGLGVRGQEAVRRIRATARDAGAAGVDGEYGHGLVDAAAAVAGLAPAAQPGSGSSGDASAPGRARVRMTRRARASTLLRHGIIARCTAPAAGRCRVSVRHGGVTVATGSRPVAAGRTASIRVRPTRRGRSVLRRADRRNRTLRARAHVFASGSKRLQRSLTIRG